MYFPQAMGNRGGAGKRNGDISGLKQFHVNPWNNVRERQKKTTGNFPKHFHM